MNSKSESFQLDHVVDAIRVIFAQLRSMYGSVLPTDLLGDFLDPLLEFFPLFSNLRLLTIFVLYARSIEVSSLGLVGVPGGYI